ncbi:hypothetical protein BHM03_00025996 [Ensete ventricosum]|nr:hypothetical protein BHM03_00025996 [Ensete ventricosum]
MACFRLPTVAISPLPVSASSRRLARRRIRSLLKPSSCNARRFGSVAASTVQRFDWDDVVRIAEEAQEDDDPPSDLRGYFEKVRLCNRGSVRLSLSAVLVVRPKLGTRNEVLEIT